MINEDRQIRQNKEIIGWKQIQFISSRKWNTVKYATVEENAVSLES